MENTNPQNKTEKIREAVKRFPYLIPMYLKDPSFDPKITYGIMKKMVPLRFGIEFECLGALDPNKRFVSSYNHGKQYKVYSIDRDYYQVSKRLKSFEERSKLNEHRVSILGFTQLNGFYNVLNKMKSKLISCPGSGIHIHIDITPFLPEEINYLYHARAGFYSKIETTINRKYLNKVYEIFGSKYIGTYNKKICRTDSKGTWVNIRPDKKTIEFRIGELTFDYEELIDIVINLQQLVKKVMQQSISKKLPKAYTISKYHSKNTKKN